MAWWNWPDNIIFEAVPCLLSNNIKGLHRFYSKIARDKPIHNDLENTPCILGCSLNDETILVGQDLLHNFLGAFTVVKCCSCGLMRTNPRPTPDSIGFYYPDDYGPYIGTQIRQKAATPSKSGIKKLLKLFKHIFKFNTSHLPPLKPGRLLEIGCASGSFLHQMANQGWQVQGIEFSEKAARAAAQQGYSVYTGSLESAPPPNESFDLIVGWMVLEHLHDPIGSLKKLREWANQDAWLVFSVPNAGSLEFSLFKNKWYALQLPTHLYHFTPATIEKVLSAGGWKIEKIFHQRNLNNLIASTGYVLRDKGYSKLAQKFIDFPTQSGYWNYALYPLAWLFSIFGQTGRMTVWARITK
ncbi:MAG: class I SAM-dependent methyltransferase [Candidatus Electrothrix sp. AR1]|nr:class I SAM-dependent methyltransferase [Candidatus Electrothrix sp. AR1]